MMHMTFYWGKTVTILFDCWRTDSWPSYLLSLAAVFAVAAFYQYLEERRIRLKLLKISKSPPPLESPLLGGAAGGAAAIKVAVAAFFGVNAAIGYMLMLAVMSFNGGVFVAICLGLMIGYLAFRSGGEEDVVTIENPCACA